jgi:hypothetical protein
MTAGKDTKKLPKESDHPDKSADSATEPDTEPGSTHYVEYPATYGDINLHIANGTAEKAREGDTSAAQEILKDFVSAIDARSEKMWSHIGPPIHWAYARYLADAFAKILSGTDAAVALGVKNSRPGRRAGAKATHNLEGLAAAFNLLLLNGMKPKQAKLSLKEHTGAAVRTIEKANNEHYTYRIYLLRAQKSATRKSSREFAVEIIEGGAKPYAAQIKAILAAQKTP